MGTDKESRTDGVWDEEVPFIRESRHFESRKQQNGFSRTSLPWLLVVLLSLYILLTTTATFLNRSQSTAHLWKFTDFASSRDAIKGSTVQFTSSLDFIDPERIYRIFDASTPVYVGNATDEIDQNWDELILPADIYISDQEALSLPSDTKLYRNPNTGKLKIELEVFHSLHCLNMIRMAVYKDLYPAIQTSNARTHVDHCIESLRELIMCEGNMTPIPIEWSVKGERINPNYAQRHSCRNFDTLRKWTNRRADAN